MGALTGLTPKAFGDLKVNDALKYKGPAPSVMMLDATLPASYDASGSIFDLSGYFSKVEGVFCGPAEGCSLEPVLNDNPALIKIKVYGAITAHQHQVPITGGQALTDQIPIAYDTVADRLEKAKETVHSLAQAGPASYSAGGFTVNLSAFFDEIPEVVVTPQNSNYQAYYVPGTNASDGKIKVNDLRRKAFAGTIAGPASYAAGGFLATLAAAGVAGIPTAVTVSATTRRDEVAIYDPGTNETDGKIVSTVASTGLETADTTNLSAVTYQYHGSYADPEVPATTNLSTVTFNIIARGSLPNTTDVNIIVDANAESATPSEIDAATNLSTISANFFVVGTPK